MTKELDAVSIGVIWDRLSAITNEVVSALVRTSFSTNVRESYDLSCMLFDTRGRSIAQGSYSMPSFTGTGPETVRQMLEVIPGHELRPGDVIATNDPWIGTGHIYDINMLRPIFHKGTLVAYSFSITHLPDIGGLGFSATARQVFEEGLRIPIMKLVEEGVPDKKMFELIAANVRTPQETLGDLRANIACNEVAERLLVEFMDETGLEDLDAVADAIIAGSENAIRRKIAEMPDGVYTSTLDVEGPEGPILLACRIEIAGDGVAVDFDGTSGGVDVGINVPLTYASAFVYYAFKCMTAPNVPNNMGCVLPFKVTAPKDCILNPDRPRPTGGRHIIGHCVAPLVMGALTGAAPGEVQADSGMLNLINVQGVSDRGKDVSSIFFACGGFGALDGNDGHPTLPSPTNMTGVPIEVWEEMTGMTVLKKALAQDSGGAGKNRGGLGQEIILRNDSGNNLTMSCLGGRTEFEPRGFLGGKPGTLRRYEINGETVHPRGRHILEAGDILHIFEPGGGGFGQPAERDVTAIRRDIANGFVSTEAARQDYPHAFDTKS